MEINRTHRIKFLDTVRGISIIAMIIHHLLFDLEFLIGKPISFIHTDFFSILQFIFVFFFISISGICCNFSRSNIKRGIIAFGLGMVVTVVTYLFDKELTVKFGILHFLGIAMILYGLFKNILSKINFKVQLILFALLFTASYIILNNVNPVNISFLFPLGLYNSNFSSGDYFPVFPYIFMFLFGSAVGHFIKEGNFPKWFYKFHIPFFSFVGKYTLWIYLLHQPILYGIMYIISIAIH